MLAQAKILGVISVLAISLAACSGNSESASNPTSPDNSSTVAPNSAAPAVETTSSTVSGSSTELKNVDEVKFKTPTAGALYGVFDVVNESSSASHKVSKAIPVKMSGWAVLANKGKTADSVIITQADNKKVLAVAPVNVLRPDVAKALNNPAYKSSGWNATIKSSNLPTGKVVIQAWAYDSTTKEATQLSRNHELDITE
ncbi:hypothetical protein [Argonema antarcticum]|uniref:hypothetical protein n=1 Tax=Argonema antarcticum TaxID=2942763 RepID=UPI0020129AFA|nr:hypothetical protein [Argonema antarcticum]MCL1475747.1 hypothetical protein [Argonema antarcticum A004/B2]